MRKWDIQNDRSKTEKKILKKKSRHHGQQWKNEFLSLTARNNYISFSHGHPIWIPIPKIQTVS
jgi:hypothetical protein